MKLGRTNPKVIIVDADLKGSLMVEEFAQRYPGRFFEVGVAEQNAAGVAAGLALEGFIPFVTSFACFSPTINFNVIRQSICLSRANVKIVGSHGGLMTGADGASHQALEDIALMRVMPEMTIVHPADSEQAEALTLLAAKHQGPVYLRLTRAETPIVGEILKHSNDQGFKIGRAQILTEGKDLTIITTGPIVTEVVLARGRFDDGVIEIINCHTIKPLDRETILKSVAKTGKVLTVEDHSIIGGLGSAVAELLSSKYPLPVKVLGVPDVFGESARNWQELLIKYKIDSKSLTKVIKDLIGE
jgi:transketolase